MEDFKRHRSGKIPQNELKFDPPVKLYKMPSLTSTGLNVYYEGIKLRLYNNVITTTRKIIILFF